MNNPNVIILGAGPPSTGKIPSALIKSSVDRAILDWIISGFSSLDKPRIQFVGGYRFDEITDSRSDIEFVYNANWQTSGSGGSLLVAPMVPGSDVYTCYGDTVFLSDAVSRLRESSGDIVIAVDSHWKVRYRDRSSTDLSGAEKVKLAGGLIDSIGVGIGAETADAEFTGLVKLSPPAAQALHETTASFPSPCDIPGILTQLKDQGFQIHFVDIAGQWAELNHPRDLAHFVLTTKARTLETLKPLLRQSHIGDILRLTHTEWTTSPEDVARRVARRFPDSSVAVRSSAQTEDSWTASHAGEFTTVLNVDTCALSNITDAIDNVFRSYQSPVPDDEVLIQRMLDNVDSHGVVLTRTLRTGSPYHTINYDDITGDTTSVTGNSNTELKTAIVHRDYDVGDNQLPPVLKNLITAVRELEYLTNHDALDMEYATTQDGRVDLLQVRPIALSFQDIDEWDSRVSDSISRSQQKFAATNGPQAGIVGDRVAYGVMPDWNPAEMIGIHPRRLAYSLYSYLITDDTWAQQRVEYGYRDVTSHTLMHDFSGHPYIDVRASFNSFIPASLPDELAARLANYYLDSLETNPQFHDKIEFEIAHTCLTFDSPDVWRRLADADFSESEISSIRTSLTEITRAAFTHREMDLNRLETLERRFVASDSDDSGPLQRALTLLEDCRQYGLIAFAHMARTAFVAVAMLRSLETVGITATAQTSDFLKSVRTVATEIELDGTRVASGDLCWDSFVGTYGHLRPGTYEITVPRYDSDPEHFLRPLVLRRPDAREPQAFRDVEFWDKPTRLQIDAALQDLDLNINVDEFERFVQISIQDREYAKLLFTKNVSAALELIAEWGETEGLTPDQLSYIAISEMSSFVDERPGNNHDRIMTLISAGQMSHQTALRVELPAVIFQESDFQAFVVDPDEPNFITVKRARAQTVDLSREDLHDVDLNGKIALIPQADPGYDWILSAGLSGLITMYGGANSHMSIRAAEMDLPAAIGVGEHAYERFAVARVLDLDCESKRIVIIQ